MGFMVGYAGMVTWNGMYGVTYVHEVTRWAADISADVIDGTSMDNTDGWRRKKLGLLGGAGIIECNIDTNLTPPMVGGANRSPVYLTLTASALASDPDAGAQIDFNGTAFLTGVHPSVTVEGKVKVRDSLSVKVKGKSIPLKIYSI